MASVLIAEDSPLYRRMCAEQLTEDGFDVISAEDGLEAYNMWRERSVDLLITDLNMPELDGFELIRQIRNKPGGTRFPIIVATVRKQREDVKRAVELGADDYLVKDQTDFKNVLNKVQNQLRKTQ